MNSTEGSPKELFESGEIYASLECYLNLCVSSGSGDGEGISPDGKIKARSGKSKKAPDCCFPNVAGFCRFLGVSTGELERLGGEYPEEYGRILAVLEDEALNSELPPSIISTYMKQSFTRRDDEGDETISEKDVGPITLIFDHDIDRDGR